MRREHEGPIESSTLTGGVEDGTGSTGRTEDELDKLAFLLARRTPLRARCLRRWGGRGGLDTTGRSLVCIAGGVSQTGLGWGGGGGTVVDMVLLGTRNVVAENGGLFPVRHRAGVRKGVESQRGTAEDRENVPAISAIFIPISNLFRLQNEIRALRFPGEIGIRDRMSE